MTNRNTSKNYLPNLERMIIMKKFLTSLLALALICGVTVSVVGCGGGDKKDAKKDEKKEKKEKE